MKDMEQQTVYPKDLKMYAPHKHAGGTLLVTAKMGLKPRYSVGECKDWLRHTRI